MGRVFVLHTRIAEGPVPQRLVELLERLPYAKRLELEWRDARGRYSSLAGIALVLAGAAAMCGRSAAATALRFPAGERPRLAGGPFFSVSHGTRTVAVALSEATEIGFDLEDVPDEQHDSPTVLADLGRWTAIEAVVKAAGLGLRHASEVQLDPLLESATLSGDVYRLTPVTISAQVVAHLATVVAVDSVVVTAFDPGQAAIPLT